MLTTKKIKKNVMVIFKTDNEIEEFLEKSGRAMFDLGNPGSDVVVSKGDDLLEALKSAGEGKKIAHLTHNPKDVGLVCRDRSWDIVVHKKSKRSFLVNMNLLETDNPVDAIKKMYDKKW